MTLKKFVPLIVVSRVETDADNEIMKTVGNDNDEELPGSLRVRDRYGCLISDLRSLKIFFVPFNFLPSADICNSCDIFHDNF